MYEYLAPDKETANRIILACIREAIKHGDLNEALRFVRMLKGETIGRC
jgi:hypothetical protein